MNRFEPCLYPAFWYTIMKELKASLLSRGRSRFGKLRCSRSRLNWKNLKIRMDSSAAKSSRPIYNQQLCGSFEWCLYYLYTKVASLHGLGLYCKLSKFYCKPKLSFSTIHLDIILFAPQCCPSMATSRGFRLWNHSCVWCKRNSPVYFFSRYATHIRWKIYVLHTFFIRGLFHCESFHWQQFINFHLISIQCSDREVELIKRSISLLGSAPNESTVKLLQAQQHDHSKLTTDKAF